MALRIFKISDYDHIAEEKQFESICQLLQNRYKDSIEECILIGNYNIEGVELDALLITSGGSRILEFKNWGGNIIARENGAWFSDGKIIEGGAGKKTPFEQMRLNKSRVSRGLQKLLNVEPKNISAAIIFLQDSTIDVTQLSDTVKSWLKVCDNAHLNKVFSGLDQEVFSSGWMTSIPARLHIEEFEKKKNSDSSFTVNEAYEPEAATNFFDELENGLSQLPDYSKLYRVYNRVFQKSIDQKISVTRLNFSGVFAKTDYLLKEYLASRQLVRAVNDTRVRLRRCYELSAEEFKQNYLYDLKNLCEFIALIYGIQIPESLSRVFPKTDRKIQWRELKGECLRIIVDSWDEEYIYANGEESNVDILKVNYTHTGLYNKGDWSYIRDLLYKDAQLNLIRPRQEGEVLYPELIIFEPDYLVDISSIARCFAPYAESPFVNLVKRIEPAKTTEAIVLGNLAGQLLDEAIHQLPNTHSYAQSVRDFFKSNALSLLEANPGTQFHNDAQLQKQNIQRALSDGMRNENFRNFDSKEGLVEPSFFSEMLGIQGRMDYLQYDFKFLIEQKSGKGDFPYDNFIRPRHKEEHYVQLLLYMALVRYNFRGVFEHNGQDLRAFLLYSKYKESLVGLGFAPDLFFRALKVRNGIAWTDMLYTQPNGYRILEGLTPDKLNLKRLQGRLWNDFLYPQLTELLEPIQKASDLEKAYYFRFLTFIANEHMMSKLGNKTKDNSGFASIWHDSLEEKLLAGNIYDKLRLVSPNNETEGGIECVVLQFSETPENDMSNFRIGDIVILYSYEQNHEPDAQKAMVFRCKIKNITSDLLTLRLNVSQSDKRAFLRNQQKLWAIEHDFMESSYSSLYRGIHAFLSAPKDRRDLLLLQRKPEVDASIILKGDYGNFNEMVLRVKQAKDLFLIIGPPGTGKTSFGMLNTVKEELLEQDSSVLIMSYTNRAVDEICSKLLEEESTCDFIRIGGELSCSEAYRDHLLSEKVATINNVDGLRRLLRSTRIFVGTTTSMNSHLSLLKMKQFSLAVIDEASQILEPHLIGILSAHNNGTPAIRKVVMIGDHKQLPAVVQQKQDMSKVQEPLLQDIHLTDCRLSLFERLLKEYRLEYQKDNQTSYLLRKQGRMHHDIAIFPNYAFYNNILEEVPVEHQKKTLLVRGNGLNGVTDLLNTRRIAFVAAQTPANSPSDKVNQNEADIIAAIVYRVYEIEKERFDVNTTVGVIVPYRNQIAAIRNTIDKYGIKELHDITIDTVERYQGSQRDYIVYGFTIQKYYQLNFLTSNVFEDIDGTIVDRKLNVAMTRAREHLIMVGNPELLANNFTYYKLLEFSRSKHGYFDVKKEDFVQGNFQVPNYETEDLDLSKAVFTTSSGFDKVFDEYVLSPVRQDKRTIWPSQIFGNDMLTNLNAIGYGRINFSNQLRMFDDYVLSPDRQVMIYCYYIMRQHYCSSMNIYRSYKDWISSLISSVSGRVHMIDIGCGPATCGIAFSELFLKEAPVMVYTGIDVSSAMKKKGMQLLQGLQKGLLNIQMKTSFNELDQAFWQGCSELPSLILFNISYFFSNVPPKFTEDLAQRIKRVLINYPLNKYVFIIQHSDIDRNLESFKVFKKVLENNVNIIKHEKDSFAYKLNYNEKKLEFCYDIWSNM